MPESRYDRSVFPTLGQYDWLSGQVLYCLVRATRPRKLVEFSTSSGYSTTFSALAMQRNGVGTLHTVDAVQTIERIIDLFARELTRTTIIHIGRSTQAHLPLFTRVLHLTRVGSEPAPKEEWAAERILRGRR